MALVRPVHPGLRHHVLGEAHRRRVVQPGVRRHVDDRAAFLADHDRGDRLGAQVGALQVDVDGLVPVVLGRLEQALGDHHAGIVDQHVDAAVAGHRLVDQAPDVGAAGHVRRDRDGIPASRPDLRDHGVGLGRPVPVVDHDPGSLVGEPRRDGPPDPARCSGHDRDLSCQAIAGTTRATPPSTVHGRWARRSRARRGSRSRARRRSRRSWSDRRQRRRRSGWPPSGPS